MNYDQVSVSCPLNGAAGERHLGYSLVSGMPCQDCSEAYSTMTDPFASKTT
jgi:hypothetical protein